MKTISVQSMPNGFELEMPSFGYWVKAGVAFTTGAAIVAVCGAITWTVLWLSAFTVWMRALAR